MTEVELAGLIEEADELSNRLRGVPHIFIIKRADTISIETGEDNVHWTSIYSGVEDFKVMIEKTMNSYIRTIEKDNEEDKN